MAFSNLQTPPQKSEELALDTSNLILTTLVNAAKITNVPILQGAAASALNIVEIAQKVRSNRKAFKRLANDACALVYIVLRNDSKVCATGPDLTPAYLEYTKELSETLREIYKVTEAQTSKNMLRCIIQSKSDAEVVQEYRERLWQSLDVFYLQSNISIQESLASISDLLAPRKYVKTDQSDEVTPTCDRSEEAHINEDQIVEARGPGNKEQAHYSVEEVSTVTHLGNLDNQFVEHTLRLQEQNEEILLLLKVIFESIFILLLVLIMTNTYLCVCTQPL